LKGYERRSELEPEAVVAPDVQISRILTKPLLAENLGLMRDGNGMARAKTRSRGMRALK